MNTSSRIWLSLLITFLLHVSITHVASLNIPNSNRSFNNTISALYVFGDSTVDPGNNNNLNTVMKSNFPPYGRDFINFMPTGRFTDGRLVTDYIVSYLGIKETLPAYLDHGLNLQDLLTGVSFASAGSGFDPYTAKINNVISIQEQLKYFREYKARIEYAIGKKEGNLVISKAIFLLSAGTNDFVVDFIPPTSEQHYKYTISSYQNLLLQKIEQIIQSLIEEGANKVVVVGLSPMGCIPIVITATSGISGIIERPCNEELNQIAMNFNQQLQILLKTLSIQYPSTQILYGNSFDPLKDMMENPKKYGFDDVKRGCCGTGLTEGGFMCNPITFTCFDASKKMFWDSMHPSQQTYRYLFESLRPYLDSMLMK